MVDKFLFTHFGVCVVVYFSSRNPYGPGFSSFSFFSSNEIFLAVNNSLQYDVIIKAYKQFIE